MLRYISKLSSVDFTSKWANDFDEPSIYIQLFSVDDIIRFQAVAEGAARGLVIIENIDTGSITRINGTDTGIAWNDFSIVDFDITGFVTEGMNKITLRDSLFTVATSYIYVVSPDSECIKNTVKISYTHRYNDFDTAFITSDATQLHFDFRVEGGFLYKDIKYDVSANSFRDQRYTQNQLSNLPFRVKTFTAGTRKGVPFWVGEKLNLIFSCSDITIDGVQHVRSEGAAPEVTELKDLYPRYVYRLDVEETDNYKQALDYDTGNAFVITLEVASNRLLNALPFTENVKMQIDWGDGADIDETTSNYPRHTYDTPGTYTITVVGKADKMSTNPYPAIPAVNNYAANIIAVNAWGDLNVTNASYAFRGCVNLTFVYPDASLFFSRIHSGDYLFYGCSNLEEIPDGIFSKNTELRGLQYAFAGCTALSQISVNLVATCEELVSVTSMFENCGNLTNVIDFSHNPNIANFNSTYRLCASLTSVPDYYFSNSKSTGFNHTFSGCISLTQIPANLFAGCADATNFAYTFENCEAVNSLPYGLFKDSLGATDFTGVFSGCTLIKSLPADLFAYNTEATHFVYAFSGCTSLQSVPANFFYSNKKAYSFSFIFDGCTSLTSVASDVFNYLSVEYGTNIDGAFRNTGIGTIYAQWFSRLTGSTAISYVFNDCKNLSSIPDNLFSGFTQLRTLGYMFNGCSNIKTIPALLFAPLTALTESKYNFALTSITDIPQGLYDNCPGLTSVESEFTNCKSLTSLPASLFRANPLITLFYYTFAGCTNLTGNTPVDSAGRKLWQRAGASGYPASINGTYCFYQCSQLAEYSDIPQNWITR
jgi:uncharacterized ParB-like nuclease family protein